jgi:hypothetical protein
VCLWLNILVHTYFALLGTLQKQTVERSWVQILAEKSFSFFLSSAANKAKKAGLRQQENRNNSSSSSSNA